MKQWLITGRNSCPLCRAPGVDEKPASSLQVTNPDSDASISADSAQAAA